MLQSNVLGGHYIPGVSKSSAEILKGWSWCLHAEGQEKRDVSLLKAIAMIQSERIWNLFL